MVNLTRPFKDRNINYGKNATCSNSIRPITYNVLYSTTQGAHMLHLGMRQKLRATIVAELPQVWLLA